MRKPLPINTWLHHLRERWRPSGSEDSFAQAARVRFWWRWLIITGCLGFAAVGGVLIAKGGLLIGIMLLAVPPGIFFMANMMAKPEESIHWVLIFGFLTSGVTRYVNAPWGLMVDMFLFVGLLGWLFQQSRKEDFSAVKNDIVLVAGVWMGFLFLEIGNPEAHTPVAWFYAMRGIGFSQLLSFIIVFTYFRHPSKADRFLHIIMWFSLLGTLWGLKQMIIGIDAAEYHWLYVEDHAKQHVLHGVLRVFSFYTDAGQFGASQAMVCLAFGILALGPFPLNKRLLYGLTAFSGLIGFAISGTRGALAVPAIGGLLFLLATKNFKILSAGLFAFAVVFYILKFTFAFQGVEQVRRMRTALDPNDASLLVRLENQRMLARYLATRPIGGGVGTAGFWGQRFSPNTFLARTATDSWYVKIWAETGIVGILIHVGMLFYFLGKGLVVVWNLRHEEVRYKAMAYYASLGGILMASYGNQVFGSWPTGTIMNAWIPFIFLSPLYEKILVQEELARRQEAKARELED